MNKQVFERLFRYDPHNRVYQIGLAMYMDDDDIIMLPLGHIEINRDDEEKENENEVAYAYTRADLWQRDFVPACCKFGMVSEFAGKYVLGCSYAWCERLAEISKSVF